MKNHVRTISFIMLAVLMTTMLVPAALAFAPKDLKIPAEAERIVYGTSGEGRDLVAYRFGQGKNVFVLGFCIHGWEDNFPRDGGALVYTAGVVMRRLADRIKTVRQKDWSVYILPCMNPDGLLSGSSHNGPGRLTTTYLTGGKLSSAHGVDMNRSFPAGWTKRENERNFTGGAPLSCRESKALAEFIKSVKGSRANLLLDVHGWMQLIFSCSGENVPFYKALHGKFPQCPYGVLTGQGYFCTYARSLGYESGLFEFPADVGSMDRFKSSGYAEKFADAVITLVNEGGAAVSYRAVSLRTVGNGSGTVTGAGQYAYGKTVTLTASPAAGSKFDGWYLPDGTPVSRSASYKVALWDHKEYIARFISGYDVTALSSRSGSAAGGGSCRFGKTVTLSAAPTDGFLGWYLPDGSLYSRVTPLVVKPEKDMTLIAMFEGDIFYDIPWGAWYLPDVTKAYEEGLVAGTNAITFSPDRTLTRAETVTFLARLEGVKTNGKADTVFTDVPESAYYTRALAWAYRNGLISGVSPTDFAPDDPATREQLVTILIRYLTEYKGMSIRRTPLDYKDAADVSRFARKSLEMAQTIGLIHGSDGRLRPLSPVTRAEAMALIMRTKRTPPIEAE